MSNSSYPILFYSNRCNTCKTVCTLLNNSQLSNSFKFICVDNNNNIPKQITVVPTVVIPSIHKMYVGNEIIQWIRSIIESRKQSNTSLQSNEIKQETIQNDDKKILAYVPHEMGGVSDIYTPVKTDALFMHNHQKYKDDENNAIVTAPETLNKITHSNMKQYMALEKTKRESQDKQLSSMFENELKSKIQNFKK